MKNFIQKIKNILFIIFFIFIIYSFITILFFHISFFNFIKVLFYKGLVILFLNSILFILLILIYSLKTKFKYFEMLISSLILAFSINLVFFVIFPVTFERSVTMYLLNTLKNNQNNYCHGITEKQLENKFINEYVIKNKAIDKRFQEQNIINFLVKDNGCIKITSKALNFLELSEIIKRLYNIK